MEYFAIYKQKVEELANQKFDQEGDRKFFDYLEKLVNAEEYVKKIKYDGI